MDVRALDRSLVGSLAWTTLARWSTQLVTWTITILVARMLAPSDYGLVGMAGLFLALVQMVSEFGFGASIVILRDLDRSQIAQINALALAIGIVGFLLTVAGAPLLADFFRAPALPPILVVMGLGLVISGVRTVPEALLQRDLRFKALALIEAVQALAAALSALALAWLGFGVWALVLSRVGSLTLGTVIVVATRPHAFGFPRPGPVRRAVRISSHILGARLAWYLQTNSDQLVIGRVLGDAALGAYTLAWSMAGVANEKVAALVMRVTPAFFSAVQHDPAGLRLYFLNLSSGVALATFPATVGIGLVAEDFVAVVLGERWEAAAGPMRLLAFYAGVRCLTPFLSPVLNVTGQTGFVMRLSLVAAAFFPLGFYLGSRWGLVGVAAAWIAMHPVLNAFFFARTFRQIELSARVYLQALAPPLTGVAAMVLAVVLMRRAVPAEWPRSAGLALDVATGAASYGAALLAFHRRRLLATYQALRELRG